jgi:hypothetical protein
VSYLAASASLISFSTQLVTLRASSAAACLIRSVMPAGSRRAIRSGRFVSVVGLLTAVFFLVDNVRSTFDNRRTQSVNG